MNYFFDQGLSKQNFIQTSQSFIVNKCYLRDLKITSENISYQITWMAGEKPKTESIEILEEHWENIKNFLVLSLNHPHKFCKKIVNSAIMEIILQWICAPQINRQYLLQINTMQELLF